MGLQDLFGLLTNPDSRYTVERGVINRIKEYKDRVTSNWNIAKEHRHLLTRVGIHTDDLGGNDHPHPLSATIDEHCLHLVGKFCQDHPTTVISSKPFKVAAHFDKGTRIQNPVLCPKDDHRYPGSGQTRLEPIGTSFAFLHDVLHHLTPADMVNPFDESPDLDRMYAVLVAPPEQLLGIPALPNPVYSWHVEGDDLHYYPDGHTSGGYTQPRRSYEWLETGSITRGNTTITITHIESFYAHHILLFTRSKHIVREIRHFDLQGYTMVPTPTLTNPLHSTPIPRVLLEETVVSLLSAGAYSPPNVYSKIRAICRGYKIEHDQALLVATANTAIFRIGDYRAHMAFHYPRDNLLDSLIFNYFILLAIIWFNPVNWYYWARSSLSGHETTRNAVRTRHYFVGPNDQSTLLWRAQKAHYTLTELGDAIHSAILSDIRTEFHYPDYAAQILCCSLARGLHHHLWILKDLFHLGLPRLSVPALLAYLPFVILGWCILSKLVRTLGYVLFHRTCEQLNHLLDVAVSPSDTLRVTKRNLDCYYSRQNPKPGRTSAARTDSDPRFAKLPTGNGGISDGTPAVGTLTFNRCKDYDTPSTHPNDLLAALTLWIQTTDPTYRKVYVCKANAVLPAQHRTDPTTALQHLEEFTCAETVLLPIARKDDFTLLSALITSKLPTTIDHFTIDKRGLPSIIRLARDSGYHATLDAECFGGYNARLHLTMPGRGSIRTSRFFYLRPKCHGSNDPIEPPVAEAGPGTPGAREKFLPKREGSSEGNHREEQLTPRLGEDRRHCQNERDRHGLPTPGTTPTSTVAFGSVDHVSQRPNDCAITALAHQLRAEYDQVIGDITRVDPSYPQQAQEGRKTSSKQLHTWCEALGYHAEIHSGTKTIYLGANRHSNRQVLYFDYEAEHLESCTCTREPLDAYAPWKAVKLRKTEMEDYYRTVANDGNGVVLPKGVNAGLLKCIRMVLETYQPNKAYRTKVILGQFGSGKSSGFLNRFINWLYTNRKDEWVIAYPGSKVRDSVKTEIERDHPTLKDYGHSMVTPELAYKGSVKPKVLCIDELGRWRPGEAEMLIAFLDPEYLILNGDPLQGRHSIIGIRDTKASSNLNFLDVVARHADEYLDYSRRGPRNYGHLLQTDCYNDDAPLPSRVAYAPHGSVILTPDDAAAKCLSEKGYDAYTYGTSQGLNCSERYYVQITPASFSCSDQTIWTAMTRGKRGFDYIIPTAEQGVEIKLPSRKGTMLHSLVTQDWNAFQSACLAHRAACLPERLRDPTRQIRLSPVPNFQMGDHHGPKHKLMEQVPNILDRLEANAALPTIVERLHHLQDLCQDFNHLDVPIMDDHLTPDTLEDAVLTEEELTHHLLLGSATYTGLIKEIDILVDTHFGTPVPKHMREEVFDKLMTNQVNDNSLADQIFLRHKGTDETLKRWGIKKRLRWRKEQPWVELLKAQTSAAVLIAEFHNMTQARDCPFDQELFDSRTERSWVNMLYKDIALNVSKSYKCDPATSEEFAFLLVKQQYIKKFGKIFAKAKAPQILTEHVFRVALDLAPVFMYMYYQTERLCAENKVYLHPGKDDKTLIQWLKDNWDFSAESMEDDATAWDSNVNAPCIAFEFFLFDFFHIPQIYRERFVAYKCGMTSILGPIAFMMFSGGPDTLPFNTIQNAVLQAVRLVIPRNTPRGHGGDDVAINRVCPETDWWRRVGQFAIPQVFTPKKTKRPMMFGWVIAPEPHKDPATLLARTLFSAATNKLSVTSKDLYADVATLVKEGAYSDIDTQEQEMVDVALAILKDVRVFHHHELVGTNIYKRLGAKRHYSLENIAAITEP